MDALEIKEVAGLQAALDAKAAASHEHAASDINGLAPVATTGSYPDLTDKPDLAANSAADRNRANHTGTQAIATVVGLQTALDNKAALSHTHTSANITDFAEAVQDAVAAVMRAGTNVSLVYDDANNTYTISSSPGETFDPEKTRDAIGAALIGIGLISVSINDALDTIAISTTATQNSTDAQLRDRATHTGEQPTSTITGLDSALANKTNNATTAALSTRVTALEQVLQPGELIAAKQDWAGLTPRAALLRLINEGSAAATPPEPVSNRIHDDTHDDTHN